MAMVTLLVFPNKSRRLLKFFSGQESAYGNLQYGHEQRGRATMPRQCTQFARFSSHTLEWNYAISNNLLVLLQLRYPL